MYPIWEVPRLTAGLVLALIATIHILPSHLSTSAMWLNVYLERKSLKEGRPELMAFVKRFSKVILIFAYVFGSLTGVGIWFAATTAAPRGISGLIHNYVWGWATEWVFFLIEVAGIYVYFYTIDKVDPKTHLKLGWIFALASWTTMVIIVGILTFMLTPGRWAATGNFFDGFFNQTYWPQLVLRTTAMFSIAGAYAIAVAAGFGDAKARREIVRTASVWAIAGLVLAGGAFVWYRASLPQSALAVLGTLATPGLRAGMIWPPVLALAYFGVMAAKPSWARLTPAVLAIALIFSGIFSFERVRELVRKPFVIPGYMYSNQIIAGDVPSKGVTSELAKIDAVGILHYAPFVPPELREITDANRLQAGRMVALLECAACHTFDETGLRPLPPRIRALGTSSTEDVAALIDSLGSIPYMPQFAGTDAEKTALAEYLLSISKAK
jgi:cytochrome bd-type quinol oxidase subunit 1